MTSFDPQETRSKFQVTNLVRLTASRDSRNAVIRAVYEWIHTTIGEYYDSVVMP